MLYALFCFLDDNFTANFIIDRCDLNVRMRLVCDFLIKLQEETLYVQ